MARVNQIQRGTQDDTTVLEQLITRHWHFVYTICLSHVRHAAEAEDLTQEVFIQVFKDLTDLRQPEKFLPWLRQVARNVCRMWRRRQRATLEPLDAINQVEDPVAAARFRRTEVAEIVRRILTQVSLRNREALALHYLGGYSEKEIARALDLPTATVKSRLREGREQAKRKLMPIVKELLALQTKPGCGCPLPKKIAELTMPNYGKPGCDCSKILTDGR